MMLVKPTVAMLARVGVRPDTAEAYVAPLVSACTKFGILSREQVAGFIGESLHESQMFTRLEENLSYSADRLMVVWPTRFPLRSLAEHYAHNPHELGNYVYASRRDLGNGDIASGDGYNFRGSGLLQITGRSNFSLASAAIGIDYTAQSDLPRTQPYHAAMVSAWFWYTNGLNNLITAAGIDAVSRRINKFDSKEALLKRREFYTRCYAALI